MSMETIDVGECVEPLSFKDGVHKISDGMLENLRSQSGQALLALDRDKYNDQMSHAYELRDFADSLPENEADI